MAFNLYTYEAGVLGPLVGVGQDSTTAAVLAGAYFTAAQLSNVRGDWGIVVLEDDARLETWIGKFSTPPEMPALPEVDP